MHFNLAHLLAARDDLGWLGDTFTMDEIHNVVANLPSNKSQGPNGFNGDFSRKCWHIVEEDFYDLCDAFFNENICVQSINGSYITLMPKKDSPLTADFRPISLLNSTIKLITKLLADRLHQVIISLCTWTSMASSQDLFKIASLDLLSFSICAINQERNWWF